MTRRSKTANAQQPAKKAQAPKTLKPIIKPPKVGARADDGKMSRRKLMAGGAIGMATLGIAASSMGNLTSLGLIGSSAAQAAPAASKATPRTSLQAPLVLYILDAAGDEMRLLYGEKEVVVHDSVLVARLANAVQ